MNNHINNLYKASGIYGGNGKYEYITNTESLANKLYQSKQDLYYELKKESARDRFVYNSSAIEKEIYQAINNIMYEELGEIATLVADDIVNLVSSSFGGSVNISNNKSFSVHLAKQMGKALAQIPFQIFNEITKDK